MPLSHGDKLGPYEIIAPIGKGGMGEVFRAHDTRLNRDVAIKVSSEHFSERFEREARVVASLNHPNICALYDVGPNYLVMELVEGPTLAERITQGAIPLDETTAIARQMAAALEAAHEKGVVHRDLKPGNVKIKPDGTVKVLDFGLAKTGGTPSAGSDDSPTLTMGQTEAGMILGTAAYMPPEQAKGKPVDKRADIWAFGVVLYEMLTGRRLFQGETMTEVLASVIKEEADLNRAPAQAQLLLHRCLEKDPNRRLRDIGDAMPLLEIAPQNTLQTTPLRPRTWLWAAVAGVGLLIAFGLAGYVLFRENPQVPIETVRFQIPAPDKGSFNIYLTLSPDGRKLAYAAVGADGQNHLWIRNIDSLESRPLAGTEGAASPFWSPDSRFIAFGDGSKVKRIDVSGGPVQTVVDLPAPAGVGFWGVDGTMLIGNRGNGPGLWRVSPTEGRASQITKVDTSRQERGHGFPVLLPDGRHFLYTRLAASAESAGVFLGSLDAKPDAQGSKRILPVQSSLMYVPPAGSGPGYLVFLQDRVLMAQPFDAKRFELSGEPVALAEQIGTLGAYGFFSASATGTLAYRVGGVDANNRQLTWYDRQGKILGVVGPPVDFGGQPVISPDGGAVAISRIDRQAGLSDIWVRDLTRNTDSRLTSGPGTSTNPSWSPDGSKLAFNANRGATTSVYQKAASGVGQDEGLDTDERSKSVQDWSRDGQYLIEEVGRTQKTGLAVWVLPMFGDRKPFAYLESEFDQVNPKVSPNGQWLAYESNETKRNEIYVQSFPKPGGKWQVSTGGGTSPVWSRDGKELFFRGPDGKLMAAAVRSGSGNKFDNEPAKPLFDLPGGTFDVTKDGRFLIPAPVAQSASAPITVVVNWINGLKRN